MLRLLFATITAFTLAACSTTGTPMKESSKHSRSAYAFKSIFGSERPQLHTKSNVKREPRLGFAGFSGSQTRWGAN